MPVLVACLAYLLGSLSFGILYSRWRGGDVRTVDAPGASGIYRQYGLGPALLVMILDVLKGVLAVMFALNWAPDWTWVAVFMVVFGHNYPVYFRFDGGGGIAPLIGALLVSAPAALALTLVIGVLVMPVYRYFFQAHVKLNVIPVATAVAVPIGLMFAARSGELPEFLAGSAAMAVRALHLLKS